MAQTAALTSNSSLNDMFFDGLQCHYALNIAESKLLEAGRGLFALEKIPAGKEIFRAAALSVAAV